nr:hypothetical protein [Neobacillus sp. Marseille-Q6967]
MGKRRLACFFVLVSLVLAGCLADPVQDDLVNYINEETKTSQDLELKAVTAYESVSGANYQDDQTMYDALINDIIPTYEEFINELEAVNIETDELQEVHDVYLKGANLQHQGFLKIVEAIDAQDAGMIDEANALLNEGKENINNYLDQIEQLAEDHNVEIEKN